MSLQTNTQKLNKQKSWILPRPHNSQSFSPFSNWLSLFCTTTKDWSSQAVRLEDFHKMAEINLDQHLFYSDTTWMTSHVRLNSLQAGGIYAGMGQLLSMCSWLLSDYSKQKCNWLLSDYICINCLYGESHTGWWSQEN
jgi:hypothetical protein